MADTPNLNQTQASILQTIQSNPVSSSGASKPKPAFVTAWTEPESAANTDYQPVYPYNNITQTPGGHSFEMDDTPTRERIRLQHGKGTFLEMHPNGDEVHKIVGDGYTIIAGDHNIRIGVDDGNKAKKLNITVYGDAYFKVHGDKVEEIDGNYEQHVKGNYTQTVNGISTMQSLGNMRIYAGSGIAGKLSIVTPDYVNITGDLSVSGEISCNKLMSTTRVDAGTGVSAGPLGFVSLTGGLAIGIPLAVPFQINCAGPINSLISMSAPTGNFALMSAVLASDQINQTIRSTHTHIDSLGGLTGPPEQKEVAVSSGGSAPTPVNNPLL